MNIGWKVKGTADLNLPFPTLSDEEESLVKALEEDLRMAIADGSEENARVLSRKLLIERCEREGVALDTEQLHYLSEIAFLNLCGNGPLTPLLESDEFEEIVIIGIDKPIYVYHREKGWLRTNCYLSSLEYGISLVNKLARSSGRRITLSRPILNASLPDGSRLHASIPPISSFEMTLRKFRRNPLTPSELIRLGTFDHRSMALLWLSLQPSYSFLIIGNTASGKTTTLNALFSFIPDKERIVVLEETPEINIPHQHVCRLVVNEEVGMGMAQLVSESLRMRPDRVIVGEVRTKKEVRALFDSFMAGQARGTYATFHGDNSEEALNRILSYGIPQSHLPSLDLMIVQRRFLSHSGGRITEVRRCTEICEVRGSKTCPVVKPDGSIVKGSEFMKKLANDLSLTYRELIREIDERSKFLYEVSKKRISYHEFFNRVQMFR